MASYDVAGMIYLAVHAGVFGLGPEHPTSGVLDRHLRAHRVV